MWRHIGDNPRYVQLDEVRSSSSSNNAIKRPLASGNTVRHPLDWSSSSCGLFTGLLSLVALIINLIVYFALVNQVRIICRIPKKHSVWKPKKVALNIASEASYVYILSGQKFNKNAKNGQISLRSNSVTRQKLVSKILMRHFGSFSNTFKTKVQNFKAFHRHENGFINAIYPFFHAEFQVHRCR